MPTPRIHGIVETCLYSGDLPCAARFYQSVLGLQLLETGERLIVFGVAEKQVLLLFRRCDAPQPIPTSGGTIPPHNGQDQLHLAFAVSKDDLPAWEAHLAAHGVPIESRVGWPTGGQSIFFRDPDGHLVELATPGLWAVY